MIVTVGDRTYGWGAEVRDLPNNAAAYGEKHIAEPELAALAKAIRALGWEPFWKRTSEERVVFLCEPGKWRQGITGTGMAGQKLQVKERPVPAAPIPSE